MKKSRVARLNVCLLLLAAFCLWSWSTPACAEIWQILPFPDDSDWGGPYGQPATTNGNVVTLYGRSVRTVQNFSGPLHISYDVFLQARTASDGSLDLLFLPTGVVSNLSSPNMKLKMEYVNSGSDDLVITSTNATVAWGPAPFSLSAQTVYHCAVDVTASGGLTWIINNQTNAIPGGVNMPYGSYQLGLTGWQPDNVWQVSNFAAVPESSSAILVAFGMGFLAAIRRHKSR